MLGRILILAFLFSLGIAAPVKAAAVTETKFKIKLKVKVGGAEKSETYVIEPQKNYSLSLNKPDKNRSKIALYDKNGNKKDGLYWIDNKDLAKIMNKPLADILRLVNAPPVRSKTVCATCGTDDAQDHVEKLPEPKAENKPIQVADLPPVSSDMCVMMNRFKKLGVPEAPLKQAMAYYASHTSKFPNSRYISIADYSQRSDKKRFYLLDLDTGAVTNEKVSHGSGSIGGRIESDPNNDGIVDRCEHPARALAALKKPGRSYKTRENMTRPGFFSTGELNLSQKHLRKWPRVTKNTNSLILNGLSGKVNNTARDDGVFMHEAYYNFNGNQKMGKSWGCPAFVPGHGAPIMRQIVGGSLYYSYVPVCKGDMDYVLQDLNWNNFCATK
ncbi:MAG: murein L,D-transpeptidase catalytic domain-containing protein [Bdellovibrionota bacterium]